MIGQNRVFGQALIHRVFAVWKRGTAYVVKEESGKGENGKKKKG